MMLEIAALILVTMIWISAEVYLIMRDRSQGKGKTGIDRRTRNYNFLSLVAAISLAALTAWIPLFWFNAQRSSAVFWIGIVVSCLGLFLRYWSIYLLGRYFRTTIEIEQGQKVIQKGPYGLIRHPSYSGIILFCIGYGIAVQSWLSLLIAVSLPTIALLYRIRIEEEALIKGIGNEYVDYQKRTKKMIPFVW